MLKKTENKNVCYKETEKYDDDTILFAAHEQHYLVNLSDNVISLRVFLLLARRLLINKSCAFFPCKTFTKGLSLFAVNHVTKSENITQTNIFIRVFVCGEDEKKGLKIDSHFCVS